MARILVIDDEDYIRLSLFQMLGDDGHTVIEASDGEKGIAAFRESPSDVVITDLLMPNKEGFDTIRELRQIDSDVKIIAISGGGRLQHTNLLDVAQKLGANVIIKKPFKTEVLLDAVNTCLDTAGGVR